MNDERMCIQSIIDLLYEQGDNEYWQDEINFMLKISRSTYKKPEILAHNNNNNIQKQECNYNNPK